MATRTPKTPKGDKPVTAAQLITSMIKDTKVGGLKEVFILEAVRAYAAQQIDSATDWPAGSIISQRAWRECAKECATAIADFR